MWKGLLSVNRCEYKQEGDQLEIRVWHIEGQWFSGDQRVPNDVFCAWGLQKYDLGFLFEWNNWIALLVY